MRAAADAGASVSLTQRLVIQRVDGDVQAGPGLFPPEGFAATVKSVQRAEGGVGVELTITHSATEAAFGPTREGFDPWAFDPSSPTIEDALGSPECAQRVAACLIAGHRAQIEADGVTLLSAVGMLLQNNLRPPQWLAEAFHARWGRFERHEVASLDECFGHSPADERSRRAAERDHDLMPQVHAAIMAALRKDPARAIDIGLFEEVGEQFAIGKTKCRELYDAAVRDHGMQDAAELRKLMRGAGPARPA